MIRQLILIYFTAWLSLGLGTMLAFGQNENNQPTRAQIEKLVPEGKWSKASELKVERRLKTVRIPGGTPSEYQQPIWFAKVKIPQKKAREFDTLTKLKKTKDWHAGVSIDPTWHAPVDCIANFQAAGAADIPAFALKYDYQQRFKKIRGERQKDKYVAEGIFRIENKLEELDCFLLFQVTLAIDGKKDATSTIKWAGPFESKQVAGSRKTLDLLFIENLIGHTDD